MRKIILKFALQNAIKFNGKANPGNVIGKVLGENPKLKSKINDIKKDIMAVVKEVNKLSVKQQEEKLKELDPSLLEKKKIEKKEGLKELKNVKGKIVMRFEPSPSGPMHLGHAYALSLNSEYCRKYKGKLILRIADTNPENIYEPAYDLLVKDGKWVTKDNITKVVIQSDRLNLYYHYAEKLVDMGKAYICKCNPDEFRKLVFEKKACLCRNLDIEEHKKRYFKLFSSYKPGEAVLRLKTDINHKNPAMRDFPLMRINEYKHPRQGTKFRVWPLMNLAVFVDDVELGLTHIIRAKDHMDNAKRQEFLYKYFNKKVPETIFLGKINFKGLPMSCSKVRVLIEEGKYTGWDDIRLPFLLALKRRGYQPEAFINYALDVGVTQNDKTVNKEEFFKTLNHFNKEILDPKSHRYFFVWKPKEVEIEKAPSKNIELDLHPDSVKGGRKFKTSEDFVITEDDFKDFKSGKLYRLMGCLNFVKKGNKLVFDSLEYKKFKEKGDKIIHWLPKNDSVKIDVLMDDGSTVSGLGEKGLSKLKVGEVAQLERFAFCCLNKKEKNKLIFVFGHR